MDDETREKLDELSQEIREIHDALFKPAAGEKDSLIVQIRRVTNAVRHGSATLKFSIYIVTAIGTIYAATSGAWKWFFPNQ